MITQKIHKITMLETEAKKMAAYKTQGAVYDKSELSFKIKHVSEKGFRLIHNNVKLIAIIAGTERSITMTIFEVEKFATREEALDKVSKLKLEIENEFEIRMVT